MPMYRVTYASMTARYGPKYIIADSEYAARRRFWGGGAFTKGEMALIKATEVSEDEMIRALQNSDD